MCGFAGIISLNSQRSADMLTDIDRMADKLAHRGPDDAGIWKDTERGLALGHRRLSIIDLSQAGHQPMISATGRFVIVFNGEIYNFLSLKQSLLDTQADYPFRGHSDTEILLAAIETWGLEKTLAKIKGMFAFALWDRERSTLYLARDRLGEKPLYYGTSGKVFLFASELKAMMVHREWQGKLDRKALAMYMKYGFIPSPYSIFVGIQKLKPGHFIAVKYSDHQDSVAIKEHAYWSLERVRASAQREVLPADPGLIATTLEESLRQSLRGQMVADVPLGAFLSGGIDSTTIVALMQQLSERPVNTFSIGFKEQEFNEAKHAGLVAKHLQTDHHELIVGHEDALAVIPEIASIWDEPFADASQIPTYLVSKLARQSVKVCLSGDGGDELFAGYNRYLLGYRLWRRMQHLPVSGRRALARLIQHMPSQAIQGMSRVLPPNLRYAEVDYKLHKLARILDSENVRQYYDDTLSYWEPLSIFADSVQDNNGQRWPNDARQDIEQMMVQDALFYLPDDILTKVDRASMSVSLETRLPYLDHEVFELAWRIPLEEKINQGTGKMPLRRILNKYVPLTLMERPKSGFSLPIKDWLRGPLFDWSCTLLESKVIMQQGLFNSSKVDSVWNDYLSGRFASHYPLWIMLMFQSWFQKYQKYISV